jgi:hypothetical protein
MVVGAKATPIGSATAGELTDGIVLVYQWNGSAWVEKARLQPSDAQKGLNFGGGFGASVAIDGNRLVIGAPGDAPSSAQAVASFVPTIDNVSNNQVVFTSPHGLSEGQPISYARGAGYGDIGLNDGQLYYAIPVSGNANALQFALTPGGAAVSLSLGSTFTLRRPRSRAIVSYYRAIQHWPRGNPWCTETTMATARLAWSMAKRIT